MNITDLEARGFDRCSESDSGITVGCSKCEALCIQGLPCHETGCENQMHECAECMTLVPKRQRLCEDCANPEPFDDGET